MVKIFRILLGTEGGVYLQLLRRSSQYRSECEGLESKKCSTLGTASSPLFIEAESYRAVVMAHPEGKSNYNIIKHRIKFSIFFPWIITNYT